MKKSDLKSGMVVKIQDESLYLVVGDKLIGVDGHLNLSSYLDNLEHTLFRAFNIIKVYNYKLGRSFSRLLDDDNLELIWERKEYKLTKREVEVLKALKLLGFEWLSRDINGSLYAYEVKHYTEGSDWLSVKHKDVFNFITCKDEEFTKIDDLLRGMS